MRIYVASSWRNEYQPEVIRRLREYGHEVYDFRNPAPGNEGFHWSEIDAGWKEWNVEVFSQALNHDIAVRGFACDFDAMKASEACVLLLPSGRSAHLEAGSFVGQDRPVIVYSPEPCEPELMYRMTHGVVWTMEQVLLRLALQPQSESNGLYAVIRHVFGNGSSVYDVVPMSGIDAYRGRNIIAEGLTQEEAFAMQSDKRRERQEGL